MAGPPSGSVAEPEEGGREVRCDTALGAGTPVVRRGGFAVGTHCVRPRAGAHTPTLTFRVGVVHGFTV